MGKKSKKSVKNVSDSKLNITKPKFKPELNCNVLKSLFKNPPQLKPITKKPNYVTKSKPNLIKTLVNETIVKPVQFNSNNIKVQPKKINSEDKPPAIKATKNQSPVSKLKSRSLFSGQKASDRLKGSHFRFLNEKLYTNTGKDALKYFDENPDEFTQYHDGYKTQVAKWPMNPVDLIIQDLQKMPKNLVIADLGCGEAKIAQIFHKRKVHSFDLQPLNEFVTKCDISKVPLENKSVDIAIFCLSLMGTNIKDYLLEARRILKLGGVLKIAEIQSRMKDPDDFVKRLRNMGFKLVKKDLTNKMFSLFEFKLGKRRHKKMSQEISLEPCLYKKR